jgi:hypothetical protein
MKNAQRALVQIGTVNVTLFVSTIAFDLVHSKLAADKITILKIISYFICKVSLFSPLMPRCKVCCEIVQEAHVELSADFCIIWGAGTYEQNRRALYPLLPKVVEAVVKSLDPNIHNMRESILKTATGTLHNLVK